MKKIVLAVLSAVALNASAETARVCVNVGDADACQYFTVRQGTTNKEVVTSEPVCYAGEATVACPKSYGTVLQALNKWFADHGFTASTPDANSPYAN